MKLIVVKNYKEMSARAAQFFNEQIKNKPNSILGLATGGTPEGMYARLIDANKKHETDWSRITTFNLDEYIGIPQTHEMSYFTYMNEKLFNHVNIDKVNTHIPNGNGDIAKNGKEYDALIERMGGIDLQVLGIGENAHIAFNEPGSAGNAGTREVKLTDSTISANSRYFASKNDVPKTAITMGIGSIMKAKKIILLASGSKKAFAIKDTFEAEVSDKVPSSFLQNHSDVTVICDEEAAAMLSHRTHLACACD